MSEPTITILDKNITCPICHKNVTAFKWGKLTEQEGIYEIDFIVEHATCRMLTRKREILTRQVNDLEMRLKNKKSELLNLEYRIYQELN